ncbi:nucleosome assembly protein 1;2-like isoform X1 [Zingiber officinale]|uniref:nucleosome assembly protein 1;2-like isoform X1 n=1 Tax=Zingiber officinale TaxID=94328 RepID=UPI001C4DB44A|nr:nucleosome assembly protein 1;2-like isoform X1 [Zingiber officinale]
MTDIPNASSDLHAALNAEEDSAGVVDALKDKLQIDAEKDEVELETLSPIVRKRVEVLREIQSQHDALESKFFEERTALEDKYQKLYGALYSKRYEIVNGIAEVEGITNESATKSSEENGVPGFWLNAMNQNELLVEEIQVRDELALKYLKDIKWSRIVKPKGFKLEFFFETNRFFKNTVLTKTYHMVDEVDPILKKAIGTEIEWFPGRCLTQKTYLKKPKKGSKNTKPITITVKCDSFFNFFKPAEVPNDGADLDGNTQAEELKDLMEADYVIGSTIKDKLIPRAVRWFTGEAVECELQLQDNKEAFYIIPSP